MIVAGVDGCRAGWVVALDRDGTIDVSVVPRFAGVVALLDEGVDVIAVDMPIGLPDSGSRACDIEARCHLGPRRSSVFPAPPRPLLDATDYPSALATKRSLDGRGLSKQSFHLLPKIAEVDAVLTPQRQPRVVESHPELAFARTAGSALTGSKHTPGGRVERRRLATQVLGDRAVNAVPGAELHDVLDALMLIATARRLADGTAERLGDGSRDARGLVMEIAW